MDKKKHKNEEVRNQMGYFDCLPEEVILSILSKMEDLKILCRCLLVSKCFASMTCRVQRVSLSLPSIDMNSSEAHLNMAKFYQEVLCLNSDEIPQLMQSSQHQKMNFCTILQKFRELKYVHVEFTCPKITCSSLLKWKAMSRSGWYIFDSVIALLPASILKKSKSESVNEELENQEALIEFLKTQSKDCASLPLSCCREWPLVLSLLIKSNDTLENVTITDSHKHGIFVLQNEQLVEWRNNLLSKRFLISKQLVPKPFKLGWVHELRLPESGYLMKGVIFMMMGFDIESHAVSEYDDPVSWEFEGEEMALGEAVREILTKHKDRILDTNWW